MRSCIGRKITSATSHLSFAGSADDVNECLLERGAANQEPIDILATDEGHAILVGHRTAVHNAQLVSHVLAHTLSKEFAEILKKRARNRRAAFG